MGRKKQIHTLQACGTAYDCTADHSLQLSPLLNVRLPEQAAPAAQLNAALRLPSCRVLKVTLGLDLDGEHPVMTNMVEMPEHSQLRTGHLASPATLSKQPETEQATSGHGRAELPERHRHPLTRIVCVKKRRSRCVQMENTPRNTENPCRVFWALARCRQNARLAACPYCSGPRRSRRHRSELGGQTASRAPALSSGTARVSSARRLVQAYCHQLASPRGTSGGTITASQERAPRLR